MYGRHLIVDNTSLKTHLALMVCTQDNQKVCKRDVFDQKNCFVSLQVCGHGAPLGKGSPTMQLGVPDSAPPSAKRAPAYWLQTLTFSVVFCMFFDLQAKVLSPPGSICSRRLRGKSYIRNLFTIEREIKIA